MAGCAKTSSRTIPSGANNVYLAPVENSSSERGLENILSAQATQQLLADGRFDLVSKEKADVLVKGKLTDYQRSTLIFNVQDIPQQFRVRVEMTLTLLDPRTGETLHRFKNLYRETVFSDVGSTGQTELAAKQRVAAKLARDIIVRTVEGWPYIKL